MEVGVVSCKLATVVCVDLLIQHLPVARVSSSSGHSLQLGPIWSSLPLNFSGHVHAPAFVLLAFEGTGVWVAIGLVDHIAVSAGDVVRPKVVSCVICILQGTYLLASVLGLHSLYAGLSPLIFWFELRYLCAHAVKLLQLVFIHLLLVPKLFLRLRLILLLLLRLIVLQLGAGLLTRHLRGWLRMVVIIVIF